MELFSDWLNGRNSITREGLMTMFLKRDFSPLPLRDIVFGGYGSPLITVERVSLSKGDMWLQRTPSSVVPLTNSAFGVFRLFYRLRPWRTA